jgi:adenosylmethionine-8-amino-7-oxononanoate aminotransferase
VPAWLERGSAHVWRPYCQHQTAGAPLPVVGADGCRLKLADGRELVDGIASWWTAAHGYGHPHIRARVAAQLSAMPHVAFGGLAHEPAYALAARLAGLFADASRDGPAGAAPPSRVFFTESGSVAVEVALKMALQSLHNEGRARGTVVAFEGAYHGDTFATMSLCDPVDGMHAAFAGSGLRVVHMPLPVAGSDAFERAFDAIASDVACVIVEPLLQCAGGMRVHGADALRRMRQACDAHGAWLVFDEIATGFYRSGRRFALEEARVCPDIVVLGKALTGGTLPLAAAIANERVFSAFLAPDGAKALQHGPTYMANALACAAADASLDLFERGDYMAMVANLEKVLGDRFEPLRGRPGVVDVRIKGAMGVVQMEPGRAPSSDAFAARGAFVRPIRLARADLVYLMPPLVIGEEDLEVLLRAVEAEV